MKQTLHLPVPTASKAMRDAQGAYLMNPPAYTVRDLYVQGRHTHASRLLAKPVRYQALTPLVDAAWRTEHAA